MERTLVLIKPDAVRRGLVGEIIRRYEEKLLRIDKVRMLTADIELLAEHYAEHREKNFYNELMDYMSSGSSVAMVISGNHAIEIVRKINGATDFREAAIGTIRGDYADSKTYNLVHASDSFESAEREIKLWFT